MKEKLSEHPDTIINQHIWFLLFMPLDSMPSYVEGSEEPAARQGQDNLMKINKSNYIFLPGILTDFFASSGRPSQLQGCHKLPCAT